MIRRICLLTLTSLFASCSMFTPAEMSHEKFEVTQEGHIRKGHVSYNNFGDQKAITLRRRQTIEKIKTLCLPFTFKITKETVIEKPKEQQTDYYTEKVKVLNFQCTSES